MHGLTELGDGYLTRPISSNELIAFVKAMMRIKKAENALKEMNDNLERLVEEKTADLLSINARLAYEIEERKKAEEGLRKALIEIEELKDNLEIENRYLKNEIELTYSHDEIVGHSNAIKRVLLQLEQVARTDSTVLILGETGTGKELIARAIHRLSQRKSRQMVKINCAALPSTLIESELFGREKGAYTGALTFQTGRFEVAHKSTIFLDEISEMPLEAQAKLLRVLQDGEFERLGSSQTIHVDVRVIAATNKSLIKEVQERRFREDLFYRLSVFPITVPPLRERTEDIPMLVWAFVREFEKTMGKRIEKISRHNMEQLKQYPWPGNIRELRNVIERAMIINTGRTLEINIPDFPQSGRAIDNTTLMSLEKSHIINILKKTDWRIRGKQGAAQLLGLKPTTLYSRMKKLGIARPSEKSNISS